MGKVFLGAAGDGPGESVSARLCEEGEEMRADRKAAGFPALVLVAVALIACLGCGNGVSKGGFPAGEEGETGGEAVERKDADSREMVAYGREVHMCGRSVLGGWFEHWGWGWDYEDPVSFHGYSMIYHEMDSPPGIAGTAREVIDEVSGRGGGVVFFKLCFADFEGGDRENAETNLERNEDVAKEVVNAAMEKGNVTLLLGNALPVVREYCDEWLVKNQRGYNAYLEDLAEANPGRVVVVDLYDILATPDGRLRPEYAADPYDSHLNDAAYKALDPELENALSKLKGS